MSLFVVRRSRCCCCCRGGGGVAGVAPPGELVVSESASSGYTGGPVVLSLAAANPFNSGGDGDFPSLRDASVAARELRSLATAQGWLSLFHYIIHPPFSSVVLERG